MSTSSGSLQIDDRPKELKPILKQPLFGDPVDQCKRTAPGLEYLTLFDELLVHKKYDFTQCRIENKLGQQVFYIDESKSFKRIHCGPSISFETYVFDNFDNPVVHFYHPAACNVCCWPFCLQTMEVSSPPETLIGKIEQVWEFFGATFNVSDPSGKTVLIVKGPRCPTRYTCRNIEFLIMLPDGVTQLGNITKLWIGIEEVDDHYRLTFPADLDVKMKVLLLGACLLIDVMFYEHSRVERF